jgi:lactaldehyde reductase
VPLIAIPTTAGTASEVTINYVITDVAKRRKFVCVDPHDIPILSIVDSELMASMPKGLKAATGMDALTHAIEGYITQGAWELSDMVELKAIQLIAGNLRASVLENDPKAAEQMALGQYVAGMGYSNVGLGAVHGMGHPLGGFYDIPHGVANALLLPYVMAFNAPACGEKFREIGRAMNVPGIGEMPLEEAQKATVAAVRQLSLDVGVPAKLRELGVKEEDLPALAAAAINDVCTPGNPRSVTEADLLALYKEAF